MEIFLKCFSIELIGQRTPTESLYRWSPTTLSTVRPGLVEERRGLGIKGRRSKTEALAEEKLQQAEARIKFLSKQRTSYYTKLIIKAYLVTEQPLSLWTSVHVLLRQRRVEDDHTMAGHTLDSRCSFCYRIRVHLPVFRGSHAVIFLKVAQEA